MSTELVIQNRFVRSGGRFARKCLGWCGTKTYDRLDGRPVCERCVPPYVTAHDIFRGQVEEGGWGTLGVKPCLDCVINTLVNGTQLISTPHEHELPSDCSGALKRIRDARRDRARALGLRMEQMRRAKGLRESNLSLHLVFNGNPGTGKTTVARLISKIYKGMKLLSKGHLVETDRSGLVAGYVGQTAQKTKSVVESAIGGVLFIDEAYSLHAGIENDFGTEAIDTLLKMMEDHRNDLVVIAAGYPQPMKNFLGANPGLQSRFNKQINFEDYTAPQLLDIFRGLCEDNDYKLSSLAEEKLKAVFEAKYSNRDARFGNGREARNIFESVISNRANRISEVTNATDAVLTTIEPEDVPDEAFARGAGA